MNLKKSYTALMSAAAALVLCATTALADTTIEFIQWWEPEMPAGALRGIMDGFEAANPGIKIQIETRPSGADGDNLVKTMLATGEMTDVFRYNAALLSTYSASCPNPDHKHRR